jgi:hypothetical protein
MRKVVMASRMRCPKNHAVFMLPPKVRWSWRVLMPFLLLHIRQIAWSQTGSGTSLDSKTVSEGGCLAMEVRLGKDGFHGGSL